MADLDPRASDGARQNSEPAVASTAPSVSAEGNHAPPPPSSAAETLTPSAAADDRSGLDRAEQVVDHLAERLSSLASSWGRKLLRLGSRARESAQDFWAEVQDFRQGKKP
jgi:hypothetical protein